MIFGDDYKHEAPHCEASSSLLSLHPTFVRVVGYLQNSLQLVNMSFERGTCSEETKFVVSEGMYLMCCYWAS
jgi:hypothetical protein